MAFFVAKIEIEGFFNWKTATTRIYTFLTTQLARITNLYGLKLIGADMSRNAQSQMSLKSGKKSVSLEEIVSIRPPIATDSYAPVSHGQLIEIVKMQADKQLEGYEFVDEHYGLSPKIGENKGAKLFGVLSYKSKFDSKIALSIGLRNSYDQSLAVGVCMGAKVFVCDNLMFSGDIRVTRKHTGDVLLDVEEMITTSMEIAPVRHRDLLRDAEKMKQFDVLDNDQAYAVLGMAYGRGILKPRQLLGAKQAWQNPPQEDFKDRNLWSLYNAMTEALKTSTHRDVLESHSQAHSLIMNQGIELISNVSEGDSL